MGSLLTNPSSVPVSVTADWQPLLARDSAGNFGLNMITLTNWNTSTTAPQIAAGSKIDIMGSIASFPANEAIGGTPADGTVWLRFVVAGTAVTAQWTNTAPAWDAGNGQWANGSNVYSGHFCTKTGAVYTYKSQMPKNGAEAGVIYSGGGPLITKVMSVTFLNPSLGAYTYPHGIPNGISNIVDVSAWGYVSANNVWYNLLGLLSDVSHRAIYLTYNDINIVLTDLDSELLNKPGRIIVTYRGPM